MYVLKCTKLTRVWW